MNSAFFKRRRTAGRAAETPGELHTYCNVLNTKEVEEEEEEDVDLVFFFFALHFLGEARLCEL